MFGLAVLDGDFYARNRRSVIQRRPHPVVHGIRRVQPGLIDVRHNRRRGGFRFGILRPTTDLTGRDPHRGRGHAHDVDHRVGAGLIEFLGRDHAQFHAPVELPALTGIVQPQGIIRPKTHQGDLFRLQTQGGSQILSDRPRPGHGQHVIAGEFLLAPRADGHVVRMAGHMHVQHLPGFQQIRQLVQFPEVTLLDLGAEGFEPGTQHHVRLEGQHFIQLQAHRRGDRIGPPGLTIGHRISELGSHRQVAAFTEMCQVRFEAQHKIRIGDDLAKAVDQEVVLDLGITQHLAAQAGAARPVSDAVGQDHRQTQVFQFDGAVGDFQATTQDRAHSRGRQQQRDLSLGDRFGDVPKVKIRPPQGSALDVDKTGIGSTGRTGIVEADQGFMTIGQCRDIDLDHVGTRRDPLEVVTSPVVRHAEGAVLQENANAGNTGALFITGQFAFSNNHAAGYEAGVPEKDIPYECPDNSLARSHAAFRVGPGRADSLPGSGPSRHLNHVLDTHDPGHGHVTQIEGQSPAIGSGHRFEQHAVPGCCRTLLIGKSRRQFVGNHRLQRHSHSTVLQAQGVLEEIPLADQFTASRLGQGQLIRGGYRIHGKINIQGRPRIHGERLTSGTWFGNGERRAR